MAGGRPTTIRSLATYVPPRVPISGEEYHALRGVLAQYSRHDCIAGDLCSCHGR